MRFQVRLEVVDGLVWLTVYDGDGDEWESARLADVLKVPNAIYDIPARANDDDVAGLETLYAEVYRASLELHR